jgi:hypothetical protein
MRKNPNRWNAGVAITNGKRLLRLSSYDRPFCAVSLTMYTILFCRLRDVSYYELL